MPDKKDVSLGYGNPPEWSRFKKGQSGNPKGRPRKKAPSEPAPGETAFERIYRREIDRKYRVKDGDATIELTGLEVVARAHFQAAAKGSPHAQREVLLLARELEARALKRQFDAENERHRDFENALLFKELRTRIWNAAARDAAEPDAPWPHPDDILLDHGGKTWTVRGPLNEADMPLFEYCAAERDVAFAEAELAFRARGKSGLANVRLWELTWTIWDSLLPLRWQFQPRLDRWRFNLAIPGTAKLRRLRDGLRAEADVLKVKARISPRSKEDYHLANTIMKPALKLAGYRSLAEFEHACGPTGDPAWPKVCHKEEG